MQGKYVVLTAGSPSSMPTTRCSLRLTRLSALNLTALMRVSIKQNAKENLKAIVLKKNNTCQLTTHVFTLVSTGPGQLTAEVRGPSGTVPCEIDHRGNGRYLVSFMPRMPGMYSIFYWHDSTKFYNRKKLKVQCDELFWCNYIWFILVIAIWDLTGEHYLCIWWADIPLPRTPFVGFARGGAVQAPPPVAAPAPMAAAPNHEKVILTGRGLQEARVNQEAEFVIDGTEAGPGIPEVKLSGVKADIQVHSQSLGDNKYRCVYTPTIPGNFFFCVLHYVSSGMEHHLKR